MSQRAILAAVAAAVIVLGQAPALARGGGGHGGFGGRGAFAGRSGFSGRAGLLSATGSLAVRGSGFARGASGFTGSGGFVSRIIQPEVIAVSPMTGSGAIVPPFTVPIVTPFGAPGSNPVAGSLPVVVTPYRGTPAFGAGVMAAAPGLPGLSRAQIAWSGSALGPVAVLEARPGGPLTACYPVPYGYHCNWPS